MMTLYVAGPIPDQRLPAEILLVAEKLYGSVYSWCAGHGVKTEIPHRDPGSRETIFEFHERIRSLIQDSNWVLVIPVTNSVATGIEAEYARQLEKPIGVWYPRSFGRSRLLSAIATAVRKDDEPLEYFLDRFVRY